MALQFEPTQEGLEEAQAQADFYSRVGRDKAAWLRMKPKPGSRWAPPKDRTGKLLLFAYMADASDVAEFNLVKGMPFHECACHVDSTDIVHIQ